MSAPTFPRANDQYTYLVWEEWASLEWCEELRSVCQKYHQDLLVVVAKVTNTYFPTRFERSAPMTGAILAQKLQDDTQNGWAGLTQPVVSGVVVG